MDDLFLNPARIGGIIAEIGARMKRGQPLLMEDDGIKASVWDGNYGFQADEYDVQNGIAVIPVRGGLISAQIPAWFYYADCTYESLIATVEAAVNDPSVDQILMSLNSPGGTVTGCAEAAARLDALAEKKTIIGHSSMADSAAYWLASACNRIIVDPTGEVGSIGVIMTHFDVSKLLEEYGVKVTHLFSGARKADGSSFHPLSDEAQARMQTDLDYLRGVFVDSVASFRGMDAGDLLATEALTYKGSMAVDAGLADETGFFNDVLKAMADQNGSSIFYQPATAKEKSSMAKKETVKKPADEDQKETAAKAGGGDCTCDDNEPDDDEAAAKKGQKTGTEKATSGKEQPAAVDQKARIGAIVKHPEAEGRTELAQHLAFETDMTVEAAAKTLAAAPKAATEKKNVLGEAMKKEGSAKLGAGGVAEQTENATTADMKRRFAKK